MEATVPTWIHMTTILSLKRPLKMRLRWLRAYVLQWGQSHEAGVTAEEAKVSGLKGKDKFKMHQSPSL